MDMKQEIEEIDDWNPNFEAPTVFSKIVVDIRDPIIKKNLDDLDQEEDEAMQKYKELQKEGFENKIKKEMGEESDDDDDNIMFEVRNQMKKQQILEENLYDPVQDNKLQDWVNRKLKFDAKSQLVLNCPYCFIQVCFDAQRHEVYENQYRALMVSNCTIDCTKTLEPQSENPKGGNQTKSKTPSFKVDPRSLLEPENQYVKNRMKERSMDIEKKGEENEAEFERKEDKFYDKEYEELNPKDFEYYFPVRCKNCETDIGVYDFEGKVFHFYSVLPSLG